MLMNVLFLGLPAMIVCLTLQASMLVAAYRYYFRKSWLLEKRSFLSSLSLLTGIMLLLLIGNLAQVAIWALLFMLLGEFALFGEAFYHSAVNFATLGYGDIVMSEEHRVLGPLEAINGVLMIGVSTAALISALEHVVSKTLRQDEAERE